MFKQRRLWPYILITFILALIGLGFFGFYWVKNLSPEKILQNDFLQKMVLERLGDDEILSLVPEFLGFTEPRTYLILFQNNTEIRPGGGFIGTYAVVRLDAGKVETIKVEGVEVLDKNAPATWQPVAPKIITEHLGVDRWYFRDSNWSPDFSFSALQALEFYRGEGGVSADEIDTVVAITPTVLEELLRISGPVTIEGVTFTADNVTEKLEYEVEYGFDKRGSSFATRKQIIQPFMAELIKHLQDKLFTNINKYLTLALKLQQEKQILVYSLNQNVQEQLDKHDWSGRVKDVQGDYLMWVDANLAALKTDHAMQRTLAYSFQPREDGRLVARVEMRYQHTGGFDWRTTRYRTYARVYVPLGSELLLTEGSMKWDRTIEPGTVDQGRELGKQWFGTFIAIEPGETKSLVFEYLLPKEIAEQVDNGLYTLFVQKQLGIIAHGLTLDLDFAKTVEAAKPAELEEEWGDEVYRLRTNLRVDRHFEISF